MTFQLDSSRAAARDAYDGLASPPLVFFAEAGLRLCSTTSTTSPATRSLTPGSRPAVPTPCWTCAPQTRRRVAFRADLAVQIGDLPDGTAVTVDVLPGS
jgi:hypothetical protein